VAKKNAAAGVMAGVGVLVALGLLGWFWGRAPSSTAHSSAAPAAPTADADLRLSRPQLLAKWAEGSFNRLAGSDVRALLDRFLMLDAKAPISPEQDVALRDKLGAFLLAYRGTDFDEYLRFRDRATLCDPADARLQTLRQMVRAMYPDSSLSDAEDPVVLLRVLWRAYVSEGIGPVERGAVLEVVNWQTARATVRRLADNQIVPSEWDEHAGPESHFYKELTASGRPSFAPGVCSVAVPNKTSVADVVKREGAVVFADFEIIGGSPPDPPHPLLLRFYWDSRDRAWLPLTAIKLWNSRWKPFIW